MGSAIHHVLHVSQLKKHIGRGTNFSPTLPISSPEGQLKIYPLQILARRAVKRNNVALPQLLIKWSNLSAKDASWEDYDVLAKHYPSFIFEDKNNFEEWGL
jgi:Chromo (CHRromatin Organisation MOdifier) domain